MAERTSIAQVVQVGVESTAGTEVACRKLLTALSIEPSASVEVDQFRPMGQKYKTFTAIGKDWTTASLGGRLTYTEIIYPLSSVIDVATVSTPGGATDSRDWTFESSTLGEDAPKTFSVQQGSSVRAHKFNYGLVTELSFTFNRTSVELSGQMIGRLLTDGITMTAARTVTDGATTNTDATLTSATASFTAADVGALVEGTGIPAGTRILSYTNSTTVEMTANATATASGVTVVIGRIESVELVPVLGKQVSVYLDDTSGGLGGTKLTRCLQATWSIGNRYAPLWVVDAAQTSWVTHVEVEPDLTVNLQVEADAQGMGLLTALRAGDRKFLRIQAVGDEIETSYNYTFTVDTAVEVTEVGNFSDQGGVYGVEFTMVGIYDTTWGKAFSIVVRNDLTAL